MIVSSSGVLAPASLCANTDTSADIPEVFHDMPIGLQVVGQRLEEEKVLAVAEEVEDIFNALRKD